MNIRDAIPFFTREELACRHCGSLIMDPAFAVELPRLRYKWNSPLTPTSCCRCADHNRAVGGHPRSLHLDGNVTYGCATAAVDLAWAHWHQTTQLELARLAWSEGWSVGLHDAFVHLDRRVEAANLPQAVFLYGSWDGRFTVDDVRGV